MALNVTKEREVVSRLLTRKLGKPDFKIQMEFLTDVSGSARDFYREGGEMEAIFQRLAVFADKVDPDKKVQTYGFSSRAINTGEFSVDQIATMLHDFLLKAADRNIHLGASVRSILWGGTDYGEAFHAVLDEVKGEPTITGFFGSLFGHKPATLKTSGVPKLLVFNTDGEDYGNRAFAEEAIEKLIAHNYFILALGVNRNEKNFKLLEEWDDKFHGFSFVHVNDYNKLTDELFYEYLVSDELVKWLGEKGLI